MTIIAFKDGILVADGLATVGNMIVGTSTRKIIRYEDGSFAAATGLHPTIERVHQHLRSGFHYKTGDRLPVDLARVEEGDLTVFVVKPDGRQFLVFFDGDVRETTDCELGYRAFGQGDEFALGAMAAGASAEEAVRLVCARYAHCGGTIQVEHLVPASSPDVEEHELFPEEWYNPEMYYSDEESAPKGVAAYMQKHGLV